MNKQLGIIGCQSKHAEFFGSLFNRDRAFPGYEVTCLFGDDAPDRLPYVQDTAQIPLICTSTDDLIQRCDAVLITYRESERHIEPAMACIRMGKPVFIDKPFTLTVAEAKTIVDASLKNEVPVMGGSTLCYGPQIEKIIEKATSSQLGIIAYRAGRDSPFGGYRFYGSHLADLCATVFGTHALVVRSTLIGEGVTTEVRYPNQTVLLHSLPSFTKPQVIHETEHGLVQTTLDDERCYYYGMQAFVEMLERGVILRRKLEQLVFSVHLLHSMIQSMVTGDEIPLRQEG